MKNLFFRLYLLLIATFIGLGWSIDKLYDNLSHPQDLTTDVEIHKGTLFLLNKELKRHAPETQPNYLQAISPSFGYPVDLVSSSQLPDYQGLKSSPLTAEQNHYLQQGGVVSVFDDFNGKSWFLQKLSDSDHVIILGPIVNDSMAQSETIYTVVFFAGLAMIVFIWVWPISKGLMSLSKAATAFGKGDWSVRADTGISSSLIHLAERFNAMAERIQHLIKSHKELSHAVSHELRTPIARIRFAMEMARDVDTAEARHRYMDSMDDNIEELDGLVDELLTYARFDREEPQLNIKRHDMVKIVQDVINRFELTQSNITFSITLDTTLPNKTLQCDCDGEAIARILDNLIRNGIRYAGQNIEVKLGVLENQVQISVNDDGPGIPEESWSTVFDPFVRLDKSRDRNSGGIGLGLAIVKRYIELHNGLVSVGQSNMGGACFLLQWPISSSINTQISE